MPPTERSARGRKSLLVLASLVGLGALCASPWLFSRTSAPFLALFVAAAVVGGLVAVGGRGAVRIIAFNLAAIACILAALELHFWPRPQAPQAQAKPTNQQREVVSDVSSPTGMYSRPDPDLGYEPVPGARAHVIKYIDDHVAFETTYTIDGVGGRLSPPAPDKPDHRPAILFLGDSFTYGDGVHDDESYPYQTEVQAGGAFHSVNLGFSGWGPHQMLRLLETSRETAPLEGRRPVIAVYMGNDEHGSRAAGRSQWDKHGPHYALDAQGEAHYTGPMEAATAAHPVLDALLRSHLFGTVYRRWEARKQIERDTQLFQAILRRTVRLFHDRYGGRFVTIMVHTGRRLQPLWDCDPAQAIYKGLRAAGSEVLCFNALVPEYGADPSYHLPDGHFSAKTNRLLAASLVRALDLKALAR